MFRAIVVSSQCILGPSLPESMLNKKRFNVNSLRHQRSNSCTWRKIKRVVFIYYPTFSLLNLDGALKSCYQGKAALSNLAKA